MTSRRLFSLLCALAIVMAYLPFDQALAQSSGDQGNGDSEEATVSADGRYVAFFSTANNIVPDDTNAIGDVFVRDRSLAVTHRASVSSSGVQANGFVDHPQISPDGRYVVFESGATNLVSGDSNGAEDVFVRDLTSGTTSRVSLSSSGAQGNAISEHAHMSSDGRYVVFESEATNLVSSDTNAAQDIFVRDRSLGTTMRVSTNSSGTQANGFNAEPVISPDGRYVGFHSAATNLVSNDSNDDWDIYVKDLSNGAIVRASLSSNENQTTERSANAWLSDQALQIAFESAATNLVSGDTNNFKDIFVRDRIATTTERASVSSSESQADRDSQWPSISSDGRYVAFESFATNLVSGDANGKRDVFLRDRSAGTTTRVSVSSSGQEGNALSTVGMVAGSGGHVVFDSDATNLIPQDTNGFDDVFIRDLSSGATSLVSVTSGNRPPTASLSVTPEQGDTNTTFTATITASDPDGDALTYEIDWGDGTVTEASSGTHRYVRPGSYEVRGTAVDPYGSAASDSQEVDVCNTRAGSTCINENDPPDPCFDSDISCVDKPDPKLVPEEVQDAADQTVAGVQDQAPEPPLTGPGQILMVSVNALQVHGDKGHVCEKFDPSEGHEYEDWKSCSAEAREGRLAKRINFLAQKQSGDGIGVLPDVVLLQEVSGEDVSGIRRRLSTQSGVTYRIAAARDGHHEVDDREAGVVSWCAKNENRPQGVNQAQCEDDVKLVADTAILYNNATMVRLGWNFRDQIYTYAQRMPCSDPDARDNNGVLIDEDQDGEPDCRRIKWKRSYSAALSKRPVVPSLLSPGPVRVVVSSTHLVTGTHLANDTVHQNRKEQWSVQISNHLRNEYAHLTNRWFGIGGDFNIRRCDNSVDGQDYPDPPVPPPGTGCITHRWWQALDGSLAPTTPRPGQALDEAAWFIHRHADETLRPQYKDGCVQITVEAGCEDDFRDRRIDFIFAGDMRNERVLGASYDLTCGERATFHRGIVDPNCDDLLNRERYSDHRLIWTLIGRA